MIVSENDKVEKIIFQTAGFDARFPNTNQTKHCFQNYIDYYKCIKSKGENYRPCKQFYQAFHSLCPNDWIARWDEQQERGAFPMNFGYDHPYIYTGKITIEKIHPEIILEILVAADELRLEEIFTFIQDYLVYRKTQWLRQNFEQVYQIANTNPSFNRLQEFCMVYIREHPEELLKLKAFLSFDEYLVADILKNDIINIPEIEIWGILLDWGVSNTPSIKSSDSSDWSDEDFFELQKTLQNCLPLIRYRHVTSNDFITKIKPLEKLFPFGLFRRITGFQNKLMVETYFGLPPTRDGFTSRLITLEQMLRISGWIHPFSQGNKIQLLLRASRDGFSASDFHRLCDEKGPTITVVKLRKNGRLIGGYNPLSWDSWSGTHHASKSFIFYLDKSDVARSPLFGDQPDYPGSIQCGWHHGPAFGSGPDLILTGGNATIFSHKTHALYYKEGPILNRAKHKSGEYGIEDYEVFSVGFR
ncbi:hypothetical protein G9A89_001003 [Geosiphon pyriformis]|nr:hypothetical protein G9A89_001003 [Geosiphon pyriformis]